MELNVRTNETLYDVIVVGGGPAGCAAAIASARRGAKTLLVESTTALGGMATMGLVSKWAPFTDKEKVLYRSFALEFIRRYKTCAQIPEEKWDWIPIDPEKLKILYDEMVAESGATVLFQTMLCDVQTENGKITSVILSNKHGLTAYRAKIYIDCTGDADLACFSGVPCVIGDDLGNMQEASLCFAISNLHLDKLNVRLDSNPKDGVWAAIKQDPKYCDMKKHFIPALFGDGTLFANAGGLAGVDSTEPDDLSAALIKGRRTAQRYLDALREYLPEVFCDAMIVSTAPALGIRESRRIVGEYVLTTDDYLLRRSFPDEIARNCYWMDCHGSKGHAALNVPQEKRHYAPGESHGIPWRCLVPKNADNLLVAGRCISMERPVLASVRVMPNCLATGEAAGIGAAIAARDGISVHDIRAEDVQKEQAN